MRTRHAPRFFVVRDAARWARVLWAAAVVVFISCTPARREDPGGGDGDGGSQCAGAETRCLGRTFQVCQGRTFHDQASCSAGQICDDRLGCLACNPRAGRFCQGDEVHQCTPEGRVGPVVQTCKANQCQGGYCQCDANGVDLVYVVDETYRLLSFNPRDGKNEFKLIGQLSCPAGAAWGGGTATPFSMSVDRDGQAWVLYNSGEIFLVDINTAKCRPTTFAKAQLGFEVFGMGFSADAKGSSQEHLFISGGDHNTPGKGNLGQVDKTTLKIATVGPLPDTQYGAELSGTGDGELYAYYPGRSAKVARIDKTTGQSSTEWPLMSITQTVRAWAFAQWGGRFYIFVTTEGALGGTNSRVHLFDPKDGSDTIILEKLPYIIVGAGVSTCAPASPLG